MKNIIPILLVFALTAFCIYLSVSGIIDHAEPLTVQVGPHNTYAIAGGATFSSQSETPFTLKSENYFEIRQGGTVVQAIKESPAIGESTSYYWIRDFSVNGEWTMSERYATIYNATTNTTITAVSSTFENITYGILITLLSFVLWILGMVVIKYAFK